MVIYLYLINKHEKQPLLAVTVPQGDGHMILSELRLWILQEVMCLKALPSHDSNTSELFFQLPKMMTGNKMFGTTCMHCKIT